MIDEVKILLGAGAENFSDAESGLALRMAIAEVEHHCRRDIDYSLVLLAERIAVIKLNRMGAEGLSVYNTGSVSESYIDGYPADILATLNAKRKLKVL